MRESAKVLIITSVVILLLESAFRVAACAWNDQGEYYLYYGFHRLVGRVGINPNSTIHGEYYKLPPNYVLKGAGGQGSESASINSRGFRGPEFQASKPAGVFRVICLGESSTFGYHDRDDETYPVALQRLFANDHLPVEVINAGFPYYNTSSILSLFRNEILSYNPDLITFYAGFNDAGWPFQIGLVARMALWIQSHSVTYLLLSTSARRIASRVESSVIVLHHKMSYQALQRESELVADRYARNVRSIVSAARRRGIPVIVIKQPVTTHEDNYESLSYEEENERIRVGFETGQVVPRPSIEMWMFKQRRLMMELEEIAREENLPAVDNIKIVDADRGRLVSWVHLSAEANERLAEALKLVIQPYILEKERSTKPKRDAAIDTGGSR